MAWGAHAPSHVAVGAPADRFFRFLCNSYYSMQAQRKRKARIGGSDHEHCPVQAARLWPGVEGGFSASGETPPPFAHEIGPPVPS